jgi:hypothetical protein
MRARRRSNCKAARSRSPQLEALEDRAIPSIALSTTHWTPVGPASITNGQNPNGGLVSGRITGIAVNPSNANVIYVAAAGGGVWKTINGGTAWAPLTDGQSALFMGSIAVARSNPAIVYAGTGEANNSGDSYYGRGVLKSTNGGASWTLLGNSLFNRLAISKIVIDPTNANIVYVAVSGFATLGLNFSGNVGVWKSVDGGGTWTNTTSAIPNLNTNFGTFSDLLIDPSNPQTLYTAVGSYYGDTANGIYKTTNGGASWSLAGNSPSGTSIGRISLAISNSSPQTLFAAISGTGTPSYRLVEMLKTTDRGTTWTALPNVPNYLGNGWYATALGVAPGNSNAVFAAGDDQFVESTDGGQSWQSISVGVDGSGPHVDHHAMAFDANGKLLDGDDGGIWRLTNSAPGSIQWADLNSNLQLTQFYGIALHPTNPHIAYGGSQDNGTEEFTGSLPWTELQGGDGGFVRVDHAHPNTVYHEFFGISLQRSDDGGQTWFQKTAGINPNDHSNFIVPYLMDPSNSTRLILGTDHVYETVNRGGSWSAIGGPGFSGWTTTANVDAAAISASNPGTIYATAGGDIFVTFNDGTSWQKIDVPGAHDHFADLQVGSANNLVAYAIRDQFNNAGSNVGHVFRTNNGGLNWTDISGNLPDVPARTLAIDPRTHILYVGTDTGVYASTNGGASWSRFMTGLPNASVVELELNQFENVLAAGTHGRGMFEIAAAHLQVTPSTTTPRAGVQFTITVTVQDPFGQTIPTYNGTVHFTSTNLSDKLPVNYTFAPSEHGRHVFNVTLQMTGSRTITIADTVEPAVAGRTLVTVGAVSDAPLAASALRPFANTPTATPSTLENTSDKQLPTVLHSVDQLLGQAVGATVADRVYLSRKRGALANWDSPYAASLDHWFICDSLGTSV